MGGGVGLRQQLSPEAELGRGQAVLWQLLQLLQPDRWLSQGQLHPRPIPAGCHQLGLELQSLLQGVIGIQPLMTTQQRGPQQIPGMSTLGVVAHRQGE